MDNATFHSLVERRDTLRFRNDGLGAACGSGSSIPVPEGRIGYG